MSKSLIVVASAQGLAGTSATLAKRYADMANAKGSDNDWRILAETPPPSLNAQFVAAAYTQPEVRDSGMNEALAYSNCEITALRAARTLVIATPMYNFGIPGLLKSWFDQIIRPGETFEMTNDDTSPYRGLLTCDRCVVITVRGLSAFSSGGAVPKMNFLDPHLIAMLGLIGIDNVDLIDCAGVDEDRLDRKALIAGAVDKIDALKRVAN